MSDFQRAPAWAYQLFPAQSFVDKASAAGARWRGGPVDVISWYRDTRRNRAAGGDEFSQHLIALAADFQPRPGDQRALLAELRRAGLFAFRSGGAVHAQLNGAGYLEAWLRRNGYL